MAADTQDQERKPGVLASLKGAWRKVAGGRTGDNGAAATPAPAELQTSVDEAPASTAVETPAPAVQAAEPAAPAAEAAEPAAPVAEPAAPVAEAQSAPAEDPEPVSEPLDVAAATSVKAKKSPKLVPAQDPVLGESTPALGGSSSPFIAPPTNEAGPDSSWTVAQLRSLAKERGVRGYSSMSKAQLLGSLGSPQG